MRSRAFARKNVPQTHRTCGTGHGGIAIARSGSVSDRRTHKRFRLTETSEGTMRLFPDVMVEPDGDEEWIAMGREAAVPGETLILDIVPRGTNELVTGFRCA